MQTNTSWSVLALALCDATWWKRALVASKNTKHPEEMRANRAKLRMLGVN